MYFGDACDIAQHIPPGEKTNQQLGRSESGIARGTKQKWSKQTLVCLDSLLVVQGIIGKAQKWRWRDWQGSGGPVGHADLWT